MHGLISRIICISVLSLPLIVFSTAAPAIVVNVPGTSDPWLAGIPDGSTASGGDIAPDQSPVEILTLDFTTIPALQFSATGLVANAPQPSHPNFVLVGPDGNTSVIVSHSAGAENGISNISAPINSLLGVFLDDQQPDLSPVPSLLNFGSSSSRNFSTLTPGLKQVFYIGDGLDGSLLAQTFIVPNGATRLFLGTMDGSEWSNNPGSFDVVITAVPEPTTYAMMLIGLGGIGFMRKRKQ